MSQSDSHRITKYSQHLKTHFSSKPYGPKEPQSI
jgi:hypothetical protein